MPRAPPRAHACEMKRSRSRAGEEERKCSFFSHPCNCLISLLHYHASAAGAGFNSSPIYHWATTIVNLDYLLYQLPNPSITSTLLVQQPGNQISPKTWWGGFSKDLLTETQLQYAKCQWNIYLLSLVYNTLHLRDHSVHLTYVETMNIFE